MDDRRDNWIVTAAGGEDAADHARYIAVMLDEFLRHQPKTRLGRWLYYRRVNRRFKRLSGKEFPGA